MATEPATRKARNPGLTAAFVWSAKPGPKTRRNGSGGGPYPSVKPTGAKSWALRVVVKGRRVEIGPGSAAPVTLASARDKAIEARRMIVESGDPPADKRRASAPAFEAVARKVIEFDKPTWRSPRSEEQWRYSLAEYAYPTLGARPVSDVASADVLAVLVPIWTAKPETARHVV